MSQVTVGLGENQFCFEWGQEFEIGSAAFWVAQSQGHQAANFALGENLQQEVVCCMLGGFGMRAELGVAAFGAVREAGLLHRTALSSSEVEEVLSRPLWIEGRPIRYRYPRQRASWLSEAIPKLNTGYPPKDPHELRDWLLSFRGIGPKTASWIVRNHLGSDEVAIIDVHVANAGRTAGFFQHGWTPERNYSVMEGVFLQVANLGDVRASVLDSAIWQVMHRFAGVRRLLCNTPRL